MCSCKIGRSKRTEEQDEDEDDAPQLNPCLESVIFYVPHFSRSDGEIEFNRFSIRTFSILGRKAKIKSGKEGCDAETWYFVAHFLGGSFSLQVPFALRFQMPSHEERIKVCRTNSTTVAEDCNRGDWEDLTTPRISTRRMHRNFFSTELKISAITKVNRISGNFPINYLNPLVSQVHHDYTYDHVRVSA